MGTSRCQFEGRCDVVYAYTDAVDVAVADIVRVDCVCVCCCSMLRGTEDPLRPESRRQCLSAFRVIL